MGKGSVRTAMEQREYRAKSKASAMDPNMFVETGTSEYMYFRNDVLASLMHYCVKVALIVPSRVPHALEAVKGAYSEYLTYTASQEKHGEVSAALARTRKNTRGR